MHATNPRTGPLFMNTMFTRTLSLRLNAEPLPRNSLIRAVLFVAMLVLVSMPTSGCSAVIWKLPRTASQSAASASEANSKVDAKTRREPPLELSVAQAFFNEDKLSVKVRLHTKTKIDPKAVQVTVSGLREGQVVEEQAQKISEVVSSEELPADTTLALLFSLSAQELTEYQVRCSWGEQVASGTGNQSNTSVAESDPLTQSVAEIPPQTLPKDTLADATDRASLAPPEMINPAAQVAENGRQVALENVEVSEQATTCDAPPCDRILTISARVRNNSSAVKNDIRLAIGLYWVNAGMLPKIPAADAPLSSGEELIELSDLKISPNQAKRIRVKVDRKVPVVQGGSFVPHLRILGDSVGE